MKVFISGQKYFGEEVARLAVRLGLEVAGVAVPDGDRYLGRWAARHGVPVVPGGQLRAETMPSGVDLGICAHSFDYVGKRTRYKTRLGWIGYHPSLLPRHRGRSAVEWAVRMRDAVTGGSVFWLDDGIDRGPIAAQDWCFIDPALFALPPREAAGRLWREELLPMGLNLFEQVLKDLLNGRVVKSPQDGRFSTFEPGLDGIRDVYKPDLLMLPDCTVPR